MEYFVQRMLDADHYASDSLDISNISRDPLKEINVIKTQPTAMHTFETFRKTKTVSPQPPALSVDIDGNEKSPNGDLSLEKEIMAALNSCRLSDKRRSMDIESILTLDNNNDQCDFDESDDIKETTSLLNNSSVDCVDHPSSQFIENGYLSISQFDTFGKHQMDDIQMNDNESPLSQSELDGLLNHPSLELLNGSPVVHTSTPVNGKPALQPKPSLEKIMNSKNASLSRSMGLHVSDFLQESIINPVSEVKLTGSPKKAKDPAEMSLKERLALFEKNSSEPIVLPKPPSFNGGGSKRWTDKWLEQHATTRKSNDFEMVPLHTKPYNTRRAGSRDELTERRNAAEQSITKERRTYSQELLGSPPASKLSERNRSNGEIDMIISRPSMPPPSVPERSNTATIAAMLSSTISRHVEAKCSINGSRGRNDHSEMTAKLCEDSTNHISVIPVERNQPMSANGMRTSTVSRNGLRPHMVSSDSIGTPPEQHPFGSHLNPANNNNHMNNDDKKDDDRCDMLMECLLFFCCVG